MVYTVDDKMEARLDNDFTYHSPFGDQPLRYITIRETAKTLAWTIVTLTPPSRELRQRHHSLIHIIDSKCFTRMRRVEFSYVSDKRVNE